MSATVNRVSQVAAESVPGELTTPTHKLALLSITDLQQEWEVQEHRVQGEFFPSAQTLNRFWMTASVEGGVSFNDLQYPLSSVFGRAEATPVAGDGETATGSYERLFEIARNPADVQSYSVYQGAGFGDEGELEEGEANLGVDVASNALFNAFTISSNRAGDMTVGGELVGAYEPFFGTLDDSGVDQIEAVPATPVMVNIYLDEDFEGIGQTKVTDNFEVECSISDRFAQRWVHNRSLQSFAAHLPSQPTGEMTATFSKLSGGGLSPLVKGIQQGRLMFIRVEIVGPEIGGGVNYTFEWDMAVQISDSPDPSDEDGNYVASVSMSAINSGAMGGAMRARLVNSRAEL